MREAINYLKQIRFSEKSVPFALLVAMVAAFGLMIPWLGFYQDDWHHVYYAYARGVNSLWELLNYDGRPFAGWVYVIGFSLLGFRPVAWQISTLILRWLTVSFIWASFAQIWPGRSRQNFTAALLFAIYPFFVIQPLAVAYAVHWTGYLFYAISIWLMLKAANKPGRFILFTTLALSFEAIHLFTLEYFAGIELLRPILLWFVLGDENWRNKAIRVLRQWLPYLIIFLIYFIWRGFFFHSPAERGVPSGLNSLLSAPLQTIRLLFLNMIPDLVLLLASTWSGILTPESVDFNVFFNVLTLALVLISALLVYLYLWRAKNSESDPDLRWKQQALTLSVAAILFGLMPAYGAEYFIHTKVAPWNARFALGSLFGAGLLVSLLLESLIASSQKKRIVLALLTGLTIGMHTRSTNDFRHAWEAETNFYRQLILRAPGLAPHTSILAQDEFLGLMGDYPTSFALNALYAEPGSLQESREAHTWLFVIASNFGGKLDAFLGDKLLQDTKHSTSFSGKNTDSLVIRYEPDLGQCLWIITPENARMPLVPVTLQDASVLTNTSLIKADAKPAPFLQIILPEQPEDWCAYYQRGSLAHQEKNWNKAIQEWQEATKKNLYPSNGFEYLPFIESYARLNHWQQALDLTRRANKISKGMENMLCSSWARYQQQTDPSPERENSLLAIKEYLGCQ